ncbi:hypothetical protein CP533_1128 [Ophiocordyceps camponoti-saundersi (nom. inval.)]|nr:hypothetical protein CP533_1128 [Ophiocordyceps camponoti-saundersi (nom. inval.)]
MSSSTTSQPPLVQPTVNKHTFLPVKTWRGYILVSSALLPPSDGEMARIYPEETVTPSSSATESFSPELERPFDQMDQVWPLPDSWLNGYLSRTIPLISDEASAGFTSNNSAFDILSPFTPEEEMHMSWLEPSYDLDAKIFTADPAVPFYRSNRAVQAREILLDPNPRPKTERPKGAEHTFPLPPTIFHLYELALPSVVGAFDGDKRGNCLELLYVSSLDKADEKEERKFRDRLALHMSPAADPETSG